MVIDPSVYVDGVIAESLGHLLRVFEMPSHAWIHESCPGTTDSKLKISDRLLL